MPPSIATLIRYGWSSPSAELASASTIDTAIVPRYGSRKTSSRAIRARSYRWARSAGAETRVGCSVNGMAIDTARLRLLPYSPEHLLALIEGEERFTESFGLPAAAGLRDFFVSDDVSPAWLAGLRASVAAD